MSSVTAALVVLIGLVMVAGAGELGGWYRRHRIPGDVVTPYVRLSRVLGVALVALGILALAGARF